MSILTTDYDYQYPADLVATEPRSEGLRAMHVDLGEKNAPPRELDHKGVLELFQPGDLLVINNTRVEARRVFTASGLDVLFVAPVVGTTDQWQVLFPARGMNAGDQVELPSDINMTLIKKGLPQTVQLSKPLTAEYFVEHGQPALPPYIQEARGERQARPQDKTWYQTQWAEVVGSSAAPTASLHFNKNDLQKLDEKGVQIAQVTLHVGLGTFLPVKSARLDEHQMHSEWVHLPATTLQKIKAAQKNKNRLWALGTTVMRTLESLGTDQLKPDGQGGYKGETDLFIYPGFEFKYVNGLLTNFHQPQSTLLALVSAFAGRDRVLKSYEWAMKKRFRLFSYGDLTIWI